MILLTLRAPKKQTINLFQQNCKRFAQTVANSVDPVKVQI